MVAANLTDEQRDNIQLRNLKVGLDNAKAGTSRDKGKNIDPHNWGNADIPHEDLNFEGQRQALEEARQLLGKKLLNPKATSTLRSSDLSSGTIEKRSLPLHRNLAQSYATGRNTGIAGYIWGNYAMNREIGKGGNDILYPNSAGMTRPIDLVNPKSYLGKAFNEIRQQSKEPDKDKRNKPEKSKHRTKRSISKRNKKTRKRSHHRKQTSPISVSAVDNPGTDNEPSSPEKSPSSSSDSANSGNESSESSDSESNSSNSIDESSNDSSDHGPVHKQSVTRNHQSLFKPIPPEKYDGSPIILPFH
jgi:hypothetical protein